MGCWQDCLLRPLFSFQRDHHGRLMTVQKRFPDLTDGASEFEQGLIHTYIHTHTPVRFIMLSGIHSLYSNKHLKYLRAQEYIREKQSLPNYYSQSIAFKPLKVLFTLPIHRAKTVQNRIQEF